MTAFWDLGKVALKVNDLKKMTQFYQEAIGLDLMEEKENSVVLGVAADNTPLVELIQLAAPLQPQTDNRTFPLGDSFTDSRRFGIHPLSFVDEKICH